MGYVIRPEWLSEEATEHIRQQAIERALKRIKEIEMAKKKKEPRPRRSSK